MSCQGIQVGQAVPDFELDIYDAAKDDFDKFSLAETRSKKRWYCIGISAKKKPNL